MKRLLRRAKSPRNSSSSDGEPRQRFKMFSKDLPSQSSGAEANKSTVSDRRLLPLNENMNEESLKVVETFLETALGSDHADTSDEEIASEANEMVTSNPRKQNSIERRNGKLFYSVGSYRARTQRQSRRKRPAVPLEFYKQEEEYYTQEDKQRDIDGLQKEADKQKMILHQITKALIYCCASENNSISPVRVECERILLLASRTYSEITKKLNYLKNALREACLPCSETATLTVTALMLTFNEQSLLKICNEHYIGWSLCILSHEEQVVATNAICMDGDNPLSFPGKFVFGQLHKDFTINVQIYSLMIKRNIHKQYLKRFLLLPRARSPERVAESQILSRQAIFKTSDFQLEGNFSVRLVDLQHNELCNEFPFGSLQMSLKWRVETNIQLAGFLTIQKTASQRPSWDRRWSALEASKLMFWNYPSCKDFNMPPLFTLDLHKCKTLLVQPVDRMYCARPYTFLLEMIYGTSETAKYLLSTDTKMEFEEWCSWLNKDLAILRTWNTQ